MSMLLLIRSADDVRSAIEAANEFLVYQRQCVAEPREADEVIGIWLRRELDADLPDWLCLDRELGVPRDADVGIRASLSLSGLWTLCWIDGGLLRTAHSATERRRAIFDSLLGTAQSANATKTFFPVFAAVDAVESIKANMLVLEDRYPQMIGGTWFLDDWERGIVPARR